MAILNFTGFEQGTNLSTNGGDDYQPLTSGGSVQTTVKRTGAYAAKFDKVTTGTPYTNVNGSRNADGTVNTNAGSYSVLYMQFYFYIETAPASNNELILEFFDTGGDPIGQLRLDSARKLSLWDFNNYGGASQIVLGSTVLSTTTWYKISLKITAGSSAPYELLINDVSEFSGNENWAITNNLRNVFIGSRRDANGQSMVTYYDDVLISDSSFLTGDYAVQILKPNANGTTMTWTDGSGSSDYTQVDEIPFLDSDYVQSPTTGNPNTALFNFQSLSDIGVTAGSIPAVKTVAICAEASASASSRKVTINSGGTASSSTGYNGSTGSEGQMRLLTVDPNTSAAWTSSGLDAIQAGEIEDNAVATRCYSSMIYFVYTPSTTSIKTFNGLAYGSVKTVNGLAVASVKNINGLA